MVVSLGRLWMAVPLGPLWKAVLLDPLWIAVLLDPLWIAGLPSLLRTAAWRVCQTGYRRRVLLGRTEASGRHPAPGLISVRRATRRVDRPDRQPALRSVSAVKRSDGRSRPGADHRRARRRAPYAESRW